MDRTITATTLSQSEPGNNGNKDNITLSRAPELEPHYWMQFSIITTTSKFECIST